MSHRHATVEDLAADPHPILASARAEGPITWLPALDAWVVTSRAAAVDVMRDARRFTVDDPRFTTGQVIGPSMLSTDGAAHEHHRGPFADWFASRGRQAETADWMRACADELVGSIRSQGRADLVAAVASPLAVRTLAHLLGFDAAASDRLRGWYTDIVDAVHRLTVGEPAAPAAARSYGDLRQAISAAADAGRAGMLDEARTVLSSDEVAANAAVVLFGGIETSESATATALFHVLSDPELLDRLIDDRSLIPAAVEESMRLEPAAANVDRYATTDVELHGASIATGDYVVVSLAAANRDPEVFAEPDRFRLDRPNARQHTTFALGPHACLGIHIARAQTVAAVDAVLRLLRHPALAEEAEPPRGLVFRKPARVVARWETP